MTQRSQWGLAALGLTPLAVAAVGHSLHMGGPLLAAVVTVVGVASTAAAVSVAWRSP